MKDIDGNQLSVGDTATVRFCVTGWTKDGTAQLVALPDSDLGVPTEDPQLAVNPARYARKEPRPQRSAAWDLGEQAERARVMQILQRHDRAVLERAAGGATGSNVCLESLALRAAMEDVKVGKDYSVGPAPVPR